VDWFNILAVRTPESDQLWRMNRSDLVLDDSSAVVDPSGMLYPRSDSTASAVEHLSDDGDVRYVGATAFTLWQLKGKGGTKIADVGPVPVDIQVTDSRIAVSCKKWNKSGRAGGAGLGLLIAEAQVVAGNAVQAHLRRRTLLVGHLRYNWLSSVTCKRASLLIPAKLRVVCHDGLGTNTSVKALDLLLRRGIDARELLDDIAARAAKFWLQLNEEIPSDLHEQFLALAERSAAPTSTGKGHVYSYTMPKFDKVSFETVR
jgi:hypothetical protein